MANRNYDTPPKSLRSLEARHATLDREERLALLVGGAVAQGRDHGHVADLSPCAEAQLLFIAQINDSSPTS